MAVAKRWSVAGCLGMMLVTLFGGCRQPKAAATAPVPEVKIEAVVEKDVPIYSEWVGTGVGFISAQIRSRVSGYLVGQEYKEGSVVKPGDLLFRVDPRPFQTAVDQAAAKVRLAESQVTQSKAQVSASEAQVEQAKASVIQAEADIKKAEAAQRKTELDVDRYTPLVPRGAVSQQELDDAVQNNLANLAAVAAARASLANAKANVTRAQAAVEKAKADVETAGADVDANRAALDEAKLNFGYTKVISPVAGVAGFRVANIGDLVGPGDPSPLTTVSQVDPIYVQFPISEQLALSIFRRLAAEKRAPASVELELILPDGSVYGHRGKAEILDRQVDASTGTVLARGVFPNEGNVLRPGQFVKIRAITEMRKNALLVPQRAVVDQQGLFLLAVVEAEDKVALRPVKVAEKVGSQWIISTGVKAGERIVVEGVEKVKPGEKVKPVPEK